MKAIKKTIQGAIIAISALVTSQYAFAGASDTLTRLCNNAPGGSIANDFRIDWYIEGWTRHDPRTYITNKNGHRYQIQYGTSSNTGQQHQVVRIQKLAKLAYLTGQTVNMCVDATKNPYEVWIMEVSRP